MRMTSQRFWRQVLATLAVGMVISRGLLAEQTGPGQKSVSAPTASTVIAVPLVARWTFDETSGAACEDSSGNGWRAAAVNSPSPPRQQGVHGSALALSGEHNLQASPRIPLANPAGISLTAWTKTKQLSGFREIFRKEDGDHRVLFSYQENGHILSLGLNVGGYIECDAPIDPARAADDRWHHCAATFDGQWMRVYFDGDEIGHLERPGKIQSGGAAAGCLGSSNGQECFQGALDDLRIFGGPLSPGQIAALHLEGRKKLEQSSGQLTTRIAAAYRQGASLAESLVLCRQQIVEHHWMLDADLATALAVRLKAAFVDDYRVLIERARIDPVQFLAADDVDGHVKSAERIVGMISEYKPLTPQQWEKQSPADRRQWEEVEAIVKRFERLKGRGSDARYAPEWFALMAEAAPRVPIRPYLSEAVAPYMKPETPATRTLSASEAREAIQRDWLFQADGRPSPERIRQEIGWTRRLAARLEAAGVAGMADRLTQLEAIEKQATTLSKTDADLYFRVRRLKREIALKNPAIRFDKILLVDMPFPQGNEWRHETRHRLGYMAVPGGRLLVLEGLSPDGTLRQLMPQAPLAGSFWRPDVSYDGQKILFSFKPHNEKAFHLYEINADGSGLVQLTDGSFDDFDPIYLPDDRHLMFSTTRGHTYVRCMPPTNAFVLARCDRDGKNVYLVSQNNEPDYLPSVMNDGRVVYTRWEYTDKPLWRAQKLWTVNPDGTQVSTFWGNQSVWPDVMKDVRAIPGSRRVMFTGCGHHDWFAGCLGIIDPDRGLNFPDGLTKVTPDLAWPEVGNGPVDPVECSDYHRSGDYRAYFSPYPISEKDFLVSAERQGKFCLYLMDVEGNRELIYEGVNHVFHAMPLAPRPRPPAIADRVAWPTPQQPEPRDGVIFSSNVYQNAPPELRGKAKYLRVLTIEPKTYTYWNQRPYISTGPVVSIVQSEGVKRILGTVPIEADGSVAFRAPPGMPLHFQLLDEHYLALQTMRSFVGVMPGENRGCLGCHESHSRAPAWGATSTALAHPPRAITPPPWGHDTVSYPRYVRPVLDTYCSKCHEGQGDGRKVLDLTPRPGFLGFDETYALFTGRPAWGEPYRAPERPVPGFGIAGMLMVEGYSTTDPRAYRTPPPMTRLSYRSPLIELASSGKHYGVKVDAVNLQRLIAWVDAMCPYNGDEEVRQIDDPVFPGVDWLSIRPRIKTAPVIVRPGPVD